MTTHRRAEEGEGLTERRENEGRVVPTDQEGMRKRGRSLCERDPERESRSRESVFVRETNKQEREQQAMGLKGKIVGEDFAMMFVVLLDRQQRPHKDENRRSSNGSRQRMQSKLQRRRNLRLGRRCCRMAATVAVKASCSSVHLECAIGGGG